MNIFLIPSWYPSSAAPCSGIFIKEQALLYSQTGYCGKIIVSLWGHADAEVPVREPWRLVSALYFRLRNRRPYLNYLTPNFVEIRNATLHWSHRLPFGGWRQLYDKNRENFLIALERFGKVDLIHAHVGYPAGVIAKKLSEEFRIPYVITEHMGPFPFRSHEKNGEVVSVLKEAYRAADGLIAVSSYLASVMEKKGCGFPSVIPNFVDEEIFQLQPCVNKKFTFLTVCGMNEAKGIRCLLHAIKKWSPPSEKVHFIIAGDGAKLRSFKREARRLGISPLISWLGYVDRICIPKLFTQANVFVLPSKLETFGVVYLEAIASGIPVIATRCGGPEFIVNEINGFLVSVEDSTQLSQAMNRSYMNFDNFDSENIRNDFMQRFSKGNITRQLAVFYSNVVKF